MIYNEVGTRQPLKGDICRMSPSGFTMTDFEWRSNAIEWSEIAKRRGEGRKFEVLECTFWNSMDIRDTVTNEVFTNVSPFGFQMLSEVDAPLNHKLIEIAEQHAMPERLQQLFMDADELHSDVVNELGHNLIELEDATGQEKEDLLEAIKILRATRSKLKNIMHDFEIHYVLAKPNSDEAGIAAMREAAKNYKE